MSATIATDTSQAAADPIPTTFDNGRIGRLNAWFFDTFDRYLNVVSGRIKQHTFADIGAGTVLEIGAGVGANFDYLPAATRLVAVEPNEAMHPRLIERANARGIDLRILGAPAERIPVPDDSVDTVICSLVLCTVPDPTRALAEIVRVLKPGGTFRFVEHVASHPISPRRWIQTVVRRPWSWLFEGCQLDRDTGAVIEASGLTDADIRTGRLRLSAFVPVNSVIYGCATKPTSDLTNTVKRTIGASTSP